MSLTPALATAVALFNGKRTLTVLRTLYLIHPPIDDYHRSWRAMQDRPPRGTIRAIGVSKFYPDRLDVIDHSEITKRSNNGTSPVLPAQHQ